jgi:hypothetical protein
MRVVNAIPFVSDADAGIVTSTDLPLTLPRHAFDPHVFEPPTFEPTFEHGSVT